MLAYVSISICRRKMGGAPIHGFPFNLQGLSELSNILGEMEGVRMVGVEVLDFALKGSIVLLSKSPVDRICMNSVCNKKLFCRR